MLRIESSSMDSIRQFIQRTGCSITMVGFERVARLADETELYKEPLQYQTETASCQVGSTQIIPQYHSNCKLQ